MKLSIICVLQNCPPNPPVEPREPAHLAVWGSCREVQTRFVSFVFRIRSGWPGAWQWASWVGAGCDEQQGLTIFYREWHAQMEHFHTENAGKSWDDTLKSTTYKHLTYDN